MTTNTNADLIALIVKKVEQIREQGLASPYVHQLPKEGNWGYVQTLWPVSVAVGVLSDALEAAEQRAEAMEDAARRVVGQRNQLAAVVEKVRAWMDEPGDADEIAFAGLDSILDSAPADALLGVKEEAWGDGFEAGHQTARGVNAEYPHGARNPHRREAQS